MLVYYVFSDEGWVYFDEEMTNYLVDSVHVGTLLSIFGIEVTRFISGDVLTIESDTIYPKLEQYGSRVFRNNDLVFTSLDSIYEVICSRVIPLEGYCFCCFLVFYNKLFNDCHEVWGLFRYPGWDFCGSASKSDMIVSVPTSEFARVVVFGELRRFLGKS